MVRRHRHWCTRDGRDVRESASGEDVTYIPRLGLRHDLTMSDDMNDVRQDIAIRVEEHAVRDRRRGHGCK